MDKGILIKAIETYGPANQLSQATEECAEFIQAVSKRRRAKDAVQTIRTIDHLAEEIADCIIMMEQARLIVGANLVDNYIELKLERLAERLEAQDGQSNI